MTWAVVAGVAAWGVWLIREKLSKRWILKAVYVAIGEMALAAASVETPRSRLK